MEGIGFVDVHVEIWRWSFGPWMQEKKTKGIGLWARANYIDAL
jgi:hypothetical protein